MKLEVTSNPSDDDKQTVATGLSAHAAKADYPWDEEELAVFHRDGNGKIIAGLTAVTFWSCLSIKHFWVAENLRGKGIGKALLGAAEVEARRRGCKYSSLDTYTFQSPDFYTRMGYKECGRIDNFPVGQSRIFYVKDL